MDPTNSIGFFKLHPMWEYYFSYVGTHGNMGSTNLVDWVHYFSFYLQVTRGLAVGIGFNGSCDH